MSGQRYVTQLPIIAANSDRKFRELPLPRPLYPQVCAVRNAFVRAAFQPSHFLDHTAYDCGTLEG